MKSRFLPILVLAAGLCSGVCTAQAAPPSTLPECNAHPTCQSIYLEARERSTQGNLTEAIRLYKAAYEVRADPVILFSIARVIHKQGNLSEAARYYQRFLDSPLDDPEQKRKARDYLSQLPPPETKLAEAEVSPGTAPPPQVDLAGPAGSSTAIERPIYKKWWFWTAIGAGAAVAIGIGLGVGLSQNQSGLPAGVPTYHATF